MHQLSNIDIAVTGIILAPLIGFIVNGLWGNKLSKSLSAVIGCSSVVISFLLSLFLFFNYLQNSHHSAAPHTTTWFSWFPINNYTIDFSFLIDPLSLLMLLIITGIGSLIHIYSVGYMHGDEGFYKFFAYLNLFVFSMLLLVLGANFAILFAGWEGVGLCSFLLIGFWHKNTEYNAAAKKAFVMNRIGDLGFLLGMFLIFKHLGTLTFTEVMPAAEQILPQNGNIIIAITLLLFIGATGKSAQLPLFTWLPDAMAGPTPVSALIHAATMVTAGIYMICRCNLLYALAPTTLTIIAYTGIATALMAATIALYQNDIKKVLAYSTVSQLGLIFAALGVGAFASGMFHVMTHAFFKALLFLGAGSVIHGLGGEQDMRKMGGIKKHMPITHLTFFIATLAISGIPPLSGFFSKDEILLNAYAHNPVMWLLILISAIITPLYMFKLYYTIFHGNFRGTNETLHHIHESPKNMTTPLIVLAILSTIGGFLGTPHFIAPNLLHNFLHPVFDDSTSILQHNEPPLLTEILLMTIAVACALGVWFWYKNSAQKQNFAPNNTQPTGFAKIAANKYYLDEIYDATIVKPTIFASNQLYNVAEKQIIDQAVESTGSLTLLIAKASKKLQTGNISTYLFAMIIGILIILSIYLL